MKREKRRCSTTNGRLSINFVWEAALKRLHEDYTKRCCWARLRANDDHRGDFPGGRIPSSSFHTVGTHTALRGTIVSYHELTRQWTFPENLEQRWNEIKAFSLKKNWRSFSFSSNFCQHLWKQQINLDHTCFRPAETFSLFRVYFSLFFSPLGRRNFSSNFMALYVISNRMGAASLFPA